MQMLIIAIATLLAPGTAVLPTVPVPSGAAPSPAALSQTPTGDRPAPSPTLDVRVSLPQAIEAARQSARDGIPVRVALRRREQALAWTIRLLVTELGREVEREVEVDAGSGLVLTSRDALMTPTRRKQIDELRPLLAAAKLGAADAARLVMERVPGSRVTTVEADIERGRLQYDVTVRSANGLFAAEVDAISGEISDIVGSVPTAPSDPSRVGFDELRPGTVPGGWRVFGPGDAAAAWAIRAEASAPSVPNVLAATALATSTVAGRLCASEALRPQDCELALRVRVPTSLPHPKDARLTPGGAGIAWRVVDGRNHYLLRIDPTQSFVVLEAVRDGIVRTLAQALAELDPDTWHRLSVRHVGDRIECSVDGSVTLAINDSTLPGAGTVGCWAGPHAEAMFDELVIEVSPTSVGETPPAAPPSPSQRPGTTPARPGGR